MHVLDKVRLRDLAQELFDKGVTQYEIYKVVKEKWLEKCIYCDRVYLSPIDKKEDICEQCEQDALN